MRSSGNKNLSSDDLSEISGGSYHRHPGNKGPYERDSMGITRAQYKRIGILWRKKANGTDEYWDTRTGTRISQSQAAQMARNSKHPPHGGARPAPL